MDGGTFNREQETLRFPASLAQTRFWLLEALDPGKAALNVAVRWTLLGPVTPDQAEAAWRRVIDRHEVLRTALQAQDGLPIQVVYPTASFHLSHYDLLALPEAERLAEAERLGRAEATIPFVLEAPPLMRASLITIAPGVSRMLLTLHHTVCDGWSIGILAEEFTAALAGEGLPSLPLQYGDYAEWQQAWLASPALAAGKAYWTRQLANLPYAMVPTDYAAAERGPGAILSCLISSALSEEMVRRAGLHGCTPFTIALAALGRVLQARIGTDDIAIGTQIANRDDIELEPMVGCFINTVVLRLDLSASPDWDGLVRQAATVASDALLHGQFPFEMLIQALNPKRDQSRTPLFSVNLIFQRSFVTPKPRGDVTLVDMPSHSAGALYDLNFFMVERPDGWRASCEYDTARYGGSTVQAMLDDWTSALAGTPVGTRSMNQVTARLAAIWQEVLGLDHADPEDDFFDVGGHSLLAARLLSRIEAAFGRRVTMAELFTGPTLGGLARRLDAPAPDANLGSGPALQGRVLAVGEPAQWRALADAFGIAAPFTTIGHTSAEAIMASSPEKRFVVVASGADAPAAIALASGLEQQRRAVVLALIDAASPHRPGLMSRLRRAANPSRFAGRAMLFCRGERLDAASGWAGQLTGAIDVIELPAAAWHTAMVQHLKVALG